MLNAVPSSKFVIFDGWGGDFCNGVKEPTCILTMASKTKSVQANFRALYTATVEKKGPGQGVVKSPDGSMDCGSICSVTLPDGAEIILEATPERRAIFTGWEGSCSSGGGKSKTCTIKFNSDKKFVATFDHYMLPLNIEKTGPGTITSEDNKISCGSVCTTKYILDSSIKLRQIPNLNSRFKGWGGKCSGLGETCTVTIEEMNNTVTARFLPLYSFTIVNKYGGIAKTSSGISCGDQGSKSNTAKTCSLQQLEGGTSVEISLSIVGGAPQWSGCDTRVAGVCIVQMNRNRNVEISMHASEEAGLVKQALNEIFSGINPGVTSYVVNENNPPFKKTFADLQAFQMGHNLAEVKAWINDNKQWYMNQGGVQNVINEWEKGIAKEVLFEVFAPEILQYPTLAAFLADESQKPFQSALADLKFGREGGGYEGLKNWISQPANRQWYYDATGIGAHITDIEKAKLEAEIAAKRPSISSISPAGGQFGQIGNPAIIIGKFHDVQLVTLNGNPVTHIVNSEGSQITLPNIKWGVDPEGVESNKPGNVKVVTKYGEANANLISPAYPVLYNGVGEKEACFPGVGMGCEGAGGALQGILRGGLGKAIGCDAPKADGSRVCSVTPGSVAHDNCCVRYPGGRNCGGPGTDGQPAKDNNHNGKCDKEWEEAKWDTFWNRDWLQLYYPPNQEFDLTPSGRSLNNRYPDGEAISSLYYCAPAGRELREAYQAPFCCSGQMNKDKKCT